METWMSRLRFAIAFPVVLLFCTVDALAAQRTFVSSATGNDANLCTRALPCRNFAAALPLTDLNGEVIAIDSGGYGLVIITQAVSLIAPEGIYAGITAFSGVTSNAVTVNAGDASEVVLRNLSFNSQGVGLPNTVAVQANTVRALYVEHCFMNGFSEGIVFAPTTSYAQLYVTDTTIIRSTFDAIEVTGGTGIRAAIDSVRLYYNRFGVVVQSADATIRNSVAAGEPHGSRFLVAGFEAAAGARVLIENSVSSNQADGFYATAGGVMTMARCAATSNGYGLYAQGDGSTIYVAGSTITANGIGTGAATNGSVLSRGTNTLQANESASAFTNTFSSH
jgi:parallel beta helix pectate lyase-like protein